MLRAVFFLVAFALVAGLDILLFSKGTTEFDPEKLSIGRRVVRFIIALPVGVYLYKFFDLITMGQ